MATKKVNVAVAGLGVLILASQTGAGRGFPLVILTHVVLVLPFLPPSADRAKVRDIGKRVLLAEAEGIIRKAIPYLQELLHRGDFCVIPEAQDAFEKKTDFMRVFIEDELIFDADAITPTRALSNALRRWRADAGHEHSRVTVAHLEPLLVEKGAGKITNNKIDGKSVKSVRGVRLVNVWKGQAA